jgi:hypothetical protein
MRGSGAKVTNDVLEPTSPVATFSANILSADPRSRVNTVVNTLQILVVRDCSESDTTRRRNVNGRVLLSSSITGLFLANPSTGATFNEVCFAPALMVTNSRKVAMYGVRDMIKAYVHRGVGN